MGDSISDQEIRKELMEVKQSRLQLGISTIDEFACEEVDEMPQPLQEKVAEALSLLEEVNQHYKEVLQKMEAVN